jgi:hypothetical protein
LRQAWIASSTCEFSLTDQTVSRPEFLETD